MRRREFITFIGSATVWPVAVRAQESIRLGFVLPIVRQAPAVVAFFEELSFNGFVEGKNITIVAGSFGLEQDSAAERAAAVIKGAPDLIVAGGPLTSAPLRMQRRRFRSLRSQMTWSARASRLRLRGRAGNTTGVTILAPELDGKRQDLLIDAVPSARRMAALADTHITTSRQLQALQDVMRQRGIELTPFVIARPEEIASASNDAKTAGAAAVNVLTSPILYANRQAIIERTAALRLPAMYRWPELAEEGGLMGYGPRITQIFRQAARMVGKVLHGAKPGELPVEQPTKFELVINLQAAKAIGHEVPAGLVARADKIIE